MLSFINSDRPKSRWQAFKQCRRGYAAFWLLVILFIFSCLAEFIANDKPIVLYYNHTFYAPLFFNYPETQFGGNDVTPTRYQDPHIQHILENADSWALWPLSHYNDHTLSYDSTVSFPSPPSLTHWLGTTETGLDVFAILLYGFRISMLFALLLTAGILFFGVNIGAFLGYYGGRVDLLGQRFIEIWSGLPQFFLIILLSSLVVPQLGWLLLIAMIFGWMPLANSVRTEFLRIRHADYVRAAQALGVQDHRIIFRHILPNALIPIVSHLPFLLCTGVLTLATLDFLGLGLPLDTPSLGGLLWQGKNALYAPWIGLSAATTLALLLLLFMWVGDAIQAAFEPKSLRQMS